MVAVTVKIKGAGSSELLVTLYQTERSHIIEYVDLRGHRRKNTLLP
jgi:hypothetical protein